MGFEKVTGIVDFFRGFFCNCENLLKEKDATIFNFKNVIDTQSKSIVSLRGKLTEEESYSKNLYDKTQEQFQTILNLNKALEFKGKSEKELFWENKYPKATVYYTGRINPKTNQMVEVDVRLLCTPQDANIKQILSNENLFVKNPERINEDVVKIYNYINLKWYLYKFDQDNYGIPEMWEFPFEVLTAPPKSGFDCDSFANLMASFYIAAGVPAWRVRVVYGDCSLGGHSTVYVLDDSINDVGNNGTWRHLNSTYGNNFVGKTSLTQFPTTADAYSKKDQFGISVVWGSFNNQFSWQQFKTTAASENFEKSWLFRVVECETNENGY